MIPSTARVSKVKGDPLCIHFDAREPVQPVLYCAQSILELPGHVAREAISLAEADHMNQHYKADVFSNLEAAGWDAIQDTLTCTGVSEEVADWNVFSTSACCDLSFQTDLEGNLITTPE